MRTGLKLRRKEVTLDGGKVFVDGAHISIAEPVNHVMYRDKTSVLILCEKANYLLEDDLSVVTLPKSSKEVIPFWENCSFDELVRDGEVS
jgi:hypothetical protein